MMFMRILMITTQKETKKVLIVFDDMTLHIMTNKQFQAIIKELFIRCRKWNISLVSVIQSYFSISKDVKLNSTHYLILKIKNRIEFKNIAINHSADIDYQDFKKIYRKCTNETFNFLVTDTTLPASTCLVKIWDIDQVHLNKLNLSILHWVKFLIEDCIKMIKRRIV